jgi:hypothetical protein
MAQSVNSSRTISPGEIIAPLATAAFICLFFWDYPVFFPLRILAVFLHESCHALAAIFTGGIPIALAVSLDESGHTLSMGGFFPFVAAAGYIGTAVIGAILIALGRTPRWQEAFVTGLGILLLYLTFTVLRPWQWEFWVGLIFAGSWIWLNFVYRKVAKYFNLFMGSFLCIYALSDFRDFQYNVGATDAGILANSWGLPFLAWPIALVWMAIILVIMAGALRYLLKK